MPDAIFDDPRLAATYDPLDPDRGDLDPYAAMVDEFAARSVLDIGCGTGTFACLLARRGIAVTGVDPAGASLDVARGKPGADEVRWIHGDATSLPAMQVDMATMTANVAQVFLTDADFVAALRGIRAALRPGGRLVFETRDPDRRAWLEWGQEHSDTVADIPGIGRVHTWCDVLSVSDAGANDAAPGDADDADDTVAGAGSGTRSEQSGRMRGAVDTAAGLLVRFRWTTEFDADGAVLTSDSTLRFRSACHVRAALSEAGFRVDDIRDAPDRPGREFVFVATAPGTLGGEAHPGLRTREQYPQRDKTDS